MDDQLRRNCGIKIEVEETLLMGRVRVTVISGQWPFLYGRVMTTYPPILFTNPEDVLEVNPFNQLKRFHCLDCS